MILRQQLWVIFYRFTREFLCSVREIHWFAIDRGRISSAQSCEEGENLLVNKATRIRVLIIDDYPIYARGVVGCLRAEPDVECVATTSSGPEALACIEKINPDVIVLDVFPPGVTMPGLVRRIRERYPLVQILLIGDFRMESMALRLVREGADGYLLKDCETSELGQAVRVLHRGDAYLAPSLASVLIHQFRILSSAQGIAGTVEESFTDEELAVLGLLARGKSNREIADTLGLTDPMLEDYTQSIYQKLKVDDRCRAIQVAEQRGYVTPVTDEGEWCQDGGRLRWRS